MRGHNIRIALVVVNILSIITVPFTLYAQQQQPIDFRERTSYTDMELVEAIFGSDKRLTRSLTMQREKREADTPPLGPPVAIKVEFETNSATVKPEYYADLDKLGRGLTAQQFANGRILIAGHTDSVGSAPYNKRLSEKRAESVKQYLMKSFRIDSNRLQTVGYGEEKRLIEIDDTPAAQAKNRRVEVMSLRQ